MWPEQLKIQLQPSCGNQEKKRAKETFWNNHLPWCLSGSSSFQTHRANPVGDRCPLAARCSPRSQARAVLTWSSMIYSRSWRLVPPEAGRKRQKCICAGSSWHRRRTGCCCRSPAALPPSAAVAKLPRWTPCCCAAPGSCCCSVRKPMTMSFYRSIRFWVLTCRPHQARTWRGNRCTMLSFDTLFRVGVLAHLGPYN